MRRLFLALAFCLASAAPSWAAWSYYYPLTYAGASCGSSTSSNFPFLVSFSAAAMKDSAHGGDVQSSAGADIEFFSDLRLSVQLPSEPVAYDNVNGIGRFTVQGTCSTAGGTIYMAVGNATPPSRTPLVYPSNFKAVYHLQSVTDLADSSVNANTMVLSGTPTPVNDAGFTGGAVRFPNISPYVGSSGVSTSALGLGSASSVAIGGTIRVNAYLNENDDLLTIEDDTHYVYLSLCALNGSQTNLAAALRWYSGTSITSTTSYFSFSLGTLHRYVVTYDGTTLTLYVDGSSFATTTPGYALGGMNAPLSLRSATMSYRFADWSASEVFVWGGSSLPSADWIKADYNNQSAPGNIGLAGFWTYGARTSVVGDGGRRRVIVVN